MALGLYLGLRSERSVERHGRTATSAETSVPRPEAERQPARRPAPSPRRARPGPSAAHGATTYTALQRRVSAQARQALETKRAEFVKDCWAPSLAKRPLPKRARYVFSLMFDAAGREVGRGISETRGAARGDTASCLRRKRMGLTIPPPGQRVSVSVELFLPR